MEPDLVEIAPTPTDYEEACRIIREHPGFIRDTRVALKKAHVELRDACLVVERVLRDGKHIVNTTSKGEPNA
jgi:hypothetical protein